MPGAYHAVAVKLARTLAEQAPREAAPVALGTLRAGTLPLPPVTVEERLAQAASVALDATHIALGTMHDSTALTTHHTPQEDRMPDDEYSLSLTTRTRLRPSWSVLRPNPPR